MAFLNPFGYNIVTAEVEYGLGLGLGSVPAHGQKRVLPWTTTRVTYSIYETTPDI
jgi:hypothetical protein